MRERMKKRKQLLGNRRSGTIRCVAALLAVILLAASGGIFDGLQARAASSEIVSGGQWIPVEGVPNAWFYLTPDGVYHSSCFSAEGFYVEANGIWVLSKNILGAELPMRNSWLTAAEAGNFDWFLPAAVAIQNTLAKTLKKYRTLTVYGTHIMLSSVSPTTNGAYMSDRLGLYKNTGINGYTIMVGTALIGDRKLASAAAGNVDLIAYYDYEVLRYFTNAISRNGDLLAAAIYSHWMDTNEGGIRLGEWAKIGDTMVRYMPGEGQGFYEIKAAF